MCVLNLNLPINLKLTHKPRMIYLYNSFNNYFVSIGPLLANDIRCTINPMSYVKSIHNSIVIVNMSYLEVERVISSLNTSNTGWDEIPSFVAKKCMYSYLTSLTYLINKAFTDGIFHVELKFSRVVPILKAGNPSQMANYRLIYLCANIFF